MMCCALVGGISRSLVTTYFDEYNKPVLTYDFIEPYRVWCEVVVVNLCLQEVVYPDFFDMKNGGVWLNEYGKRILISAFFDYLEEKVFMDGVSRTRKEHLNRAAVKLAGTLKDFNKKEGES